MSKVGRNEPCPCGSGKKYKHCHWQTDEGAGSDSGSAMRLHELDRQLVDRVLHFASREIGRRWFGELLRSLDVELDEAMAQLVVPCAVYEWESGNGTLVDRFLRSSPRGLSERERGWLEAQRRSWLSVWEVVSVTPDVAVSVRDAFTGEERQVLERSGSRTLSPRDGVLGRVVDFEGISVFCGMHPRSLPPRPVAAAVAALRKALGSRSKKVPVDRMRAKVPLEAWILAWEEVVRHHDIAMTKLPQLQNTDGDPLLFTEDRFDFDAGDRKRIEAVLAEMAEPPGDVAGSAVERAFVFERPGNAMHKSWDNTIVGRAVVRENKLILETNSVRRADDLREKIEGRLQSLVRHRVRSHKDPEAALKLGRNSDAASPIAKRAPPTPEMIEAVRDFKRKHFESWLDTPIPALAGMTPREAATKPRKREDLVLLLKEIENRESRLPPDERVDVAKLWDDLGMREAGPIGSMMGALRSRRPALRGRAHRTKMQCAQSTTAR